MRTGTALAEALNRIGKARAAQEPILDLGDLELDTLPEELGNLPALRVLSLGRVSVRQEDGHLTRQYPRDRPKQLFADVSALAGLTSLQTLSLHWCTGLTDVSVLAGLTSLQDLDLGLCEGLTDISALAGLTSLQSLRLDYCTGLTDVSSLVGLTSLQELDLGGCEGLTDVSALADLTSLQSLRLSYCTGLTDVSALAGLTSLQTLSLHGCTGLTDVSALAGLTNLQTLRLRGCAGLTDVSALAGLTNLQTLSLHGCARLTDVGALAGLTSLQDLDLRRCTGLTDVSALAGLTNLWELDLGRCSSLRCFAPLRPLLQRLTWLDLYQCRFDDLPVKVSGQSPGESDLDAVRAHFAAAAQVLERYPPPAIEPKGFEAGDPSVREGDGADDPSLVFGKNRGGDPAAARCLEDLGQDAYEHIAELRSFAQAGWAYLHGGVASLRQAAEHLGEGRENQCSEPWVRGVNCRLETLQRGLAVTRRLFRRLWGVEIVREEKVRGNDTFTGLKDPEGVRAWEEVMRFLQVCWERKRAKREGLMDT